MKKCISFVMGLFIASMAFAMEDAVLQNLTGSETQLYNQIIVSIEESNNDELKTLFSNDNDYTKILRQTSRDGVTPLQYALLKKKHNPALVQTLLEAGAHPNQALSEFIDWRGERNIRLYNGWTAVHIAVSCYANQEILEQLHKHGGDFFQADDEQWRPVDLAFHMKSNWATGFILQSLIKNDELPNTRFKRGRQNRHYLQFLQQKFPEFSYKNNGNYFALSWHKKTPKNRTNRKPL